HGQAMDTAWTGRIDRWTCVICVRGGMVKVWWRPTPPGFTRGGVELRGVTGSLRNSARARARRNRRGPRAPPGAAARLGGALLRLRGHGASVPVGTRTRPATFPASSIGPGYRSVWHRDPHGRWTVYQDQA